MQNEWALIKQLESLNNNLSKLTAEVTKNNALLKDYHEKNIENEKENNRLLNNYYIKIIENLNGMSVNHKKSVENSKDYNKQFNGYFSRIVQTLEEKGKNSNGRKETK